MGTRKMTRPVPPRPFGSEAVDGKTWDEVVDDLGVAHRSRVALWRLVRSGPAAADAVRRGLTHPNAGVRKGCCEVLDLYWNPDCLDDLVALLDDADGGVRSMAAHALTCERCKKQTHWAKRG
jgi:hypothetical protein